MMNSSGVRKKSVSGTIIPLSIYLLISISFFLVSFTIDAVTGNENIFLLSSTYVMSRSFINFLLTISGALLIICLVIIILSSKLRRANKELLLRNQQIELINNDLRKINDELAIQKDAIAREHTESDKFFKMLIQSADDGISFYNRKWELEYANKAFYSMVGMDQDSYHAASIDKIIHPEDRDYESRRLKGLEENGFFESELRLRHRDGHYINLSTRSIAVKDDKGEVLGALTISRDITKLRLIHEDLIKANKEAEASSRLKSSFLANISHEIRTPLNSVVGFSNLLLSNELTQEVKEEYIEHINYNSEKLLQIIGDIIDLSRLESSQIEITYEEASVSEIVGEIIEEARQLIISMASKPVRAVRILIPVSSKIRFIYIRTSLLSSTRRHFLELQFTGLAICSLSIACNLDLVLPAGRYGMQKLNSDPIPFSD